MSDNQEETHFEPLKDPPKPPEHSDALEKEKPDQNPIPKRVTRSSLRQHVGRAVNKFIEAAKTLSGDQDGKEDSVSKKGSNDGSEDEKEGEDASDSENSERGGEEAEEEEESEESGDEEASESSKGDSECKKKKLKAKVAFQGQLYQEQRIKMQVQIGKLRADLQIAREQLKANKNFYIQDKKNRQFCHDLIVRNFEGF